MLISSSAALLLSGHYQHDEDVKLSQEEEEAFSQIIHTPKPRDLPSITEY